MIKTLEEIVKLEQQQYILKAIIQSERKHQISLDEGMTKPHKPSAPHNTEIEPIPDFDEKKYRKKAKESGSGLGAFRENCILLGFQLIPTIVGILVCWIPFLLAILSWPFSIYNTRKKAYQMYIADCKRIDFKNKQAEQDLEEYNIATIKYQKDLVKYNQYIQSLPQKNNFLEKMISIAQRNLTLTQEDLIREYSLLPQALPANDFITAHALLFYIISEKATTLNDAIEMLEKEASCGLISPNIKMALTYQSMAGETMRYVTKVILDCQNKAEMFGERLENHLLKDNYDTDHEKLFIKFNTGEQI